MFAAITAEGWVLIVGAVFTGLTLLIVQVLGIILAWLRENAKIRREEETAERGRIRDEQIRLDLKSSTEQNKEHLVKQDKKMEQTAEAVVSKLDAIAANVDERNSRIVR